LDDFDIVLRLCSRWPQIWPRDRPRSSVLGDIDTVLPYARIPDLQLRTGALMIANAIATNRSGPFPLRPAPPRSLCASPAKGEAEEEVEEEDDEEVAS